MSLVNVCTVGAVPIVVYLRVIDVEVRTVHCIVHGCVVYTIVVPSVDGVIHEMIGVKIAYRMFRLRAPILLLTVQLLAMLRYPTVLGQWWRE